MHGMHRHATEEVISRSRLSSVHSNFSGPDIQAGNGD